MLQLALIEFLQGIEHGSAIIGRNAFGVTKIKNRVARASQCDAIESGGKETATPHAGEQGLAVAAFGEARSKDDE